jgi:signal transduction histidine kinase
LSQRHDLPEDARSQAQEIVAATDRGAELARELMEFARPMFAPPAVLDLAAATDEFLPELQTAAGPRHEVRYSGSTAVGRVLVEKAQYRRLLANLVTNAREAMPEGGPIKIRLVPVRLSGNNVGSGGRFVLVEVSDRGVGMDEETLARVFEPYFTTKPKGTGLGLPIVQQIVDRVGGFIRIDSDPGEGTAVRMYFPSILVGTGRRSEPATPADA